MNYLPLPSVFLSRFDWSTLANPLPPSPFPDSPVFLPPETKLRQGNILTGIRHSVHGGGVHGRGGHVWQGGAWWGGHAWQGGCAWHSGVCGGGVWCGGHAWLERWPLQRAIRILLECILVVKFVQKL